MCRLQGEPGAQTDALIVCGLEWGHAGLTEAEMERPTSVIALCPNVFTRHREPCCEKMKLVLVFSPPSSHVRTSPSYTALGHPLGGSYPRFPGFWASSGMRCTHFFPFIIILHFIFS